MEMVGGKKSQRKRVVTVQDLTAPAHVLQGQAVVFLLYGCTVLSTALNPAKGFCMFWECQSKLCYNGYYSALRIWFVPTGFIFIHIPQLCIRVTVTVTVRARICPHRVLDYVIFGFRV